MRFQHFSPELKLQGLTQAAIDSESLAAKQTKGSSIILAVLALHPPPSSPRLSSTHLWRSPVQRKLWGHHGALCTASLAPLLQGRGPGLIGGSTREPSNRQAAQRGGPICKHVISRQVPERKEEGEDEEEEVGEMLVGLEDMGEVIL